MYSKKLYPRSSAHKTYVDVIHRYIYIHQTYTQVHERTACNSIVFSEGQREVVVRTGFLQFRGMYDDNLSRGSSFRLNLSCFDST